MVQFSAGLVSQAASILINVLLFITAIVALDRLDEFSLHVSSGYSGRKFDST